MVGLLPAGMAAGSMNPRARRPDESMWANRAREDGDGTMPAGPAGRGFEGARTAPMPNKIPGEYAYHGEVKPPENMEMESPDAQQIGARSGADMRGAARGDKQSAQAPGNGLLRAPSKDNDMEKAMSDVLEKYPALRPYDWSIVDSRHKGMADGNHLEFYSPQESDSPTPGKPTIEVFDKNLTGQALRDALMGDMLHHLPANDPKFAEGRQAYAKTLTPEQKAIDQQAYDRAKSEYGETRPFDQWMEQSRLDAHLRGYLAPDAEDNWRGHYTDQQKPILDGLRRHITGGSHLGGEKEAPGNQNMTPEQADKAGATVFR